VADKKLRVEIIGDADSLKKAFGTADKSSSSLGSTLGGLGKTAALAGGAAGLGALVFGLKASIDSAMEHQKAMAQTEAVVKSTGGAANVTAEDIAGMADKIEKMSGVDDLAVQSGENMLLTFTNVRNEVGKGNDVFNQATSILADMSVALGTDMSKQAIQLGKALNDPIKGVSALARVGVTFTAQQKEQIKTMVESGNTMGAQKLILKELGKEFGGSAKAAGETFGGKLAILKARLDDVAQAIGEKILPYLTKLVDWITKNWPEIAATVQQGFRIISEVFDKIKPILDTFVRQIKGIVEIVQGLMRGDWSKVWDGIVDVVGGAFDRIKIQLQQMVTALGFLAEKIGSAIWDGIKKGLGALDKLIQDNVVTPITSALSGFASSVASIASKVGSAISSAIASGIKTGATAVVTAVTDIGTAIGNLAGRAWDAVVALGKSLAGRIAVGIATGGASEVVPKVIEIGTTIGNLASRAWDAVVGLGRALAGKVAAGIKTGAQLVTDAAIELGGAVGNLAGRAWDAVKSLGRALAGKVGDGISAGVGQVTNAVIEFGTAIGNLAGRAWGQLAGLGRALVGKIAGGISGAAGEIAGAISGIFSGLAGWVKDILGISSPSKVFMEIGHDVVRGLVKGLENMSGKLKDAAVALAKKILFSWPLSKIKAFFGAITNVPGDILGELASIFGDDPGWKAWGKGGGGGSGGFGARKGALVTEPTIALIGEDGPEAVVPLSKVPGGPAFGEGITFGGGSSAGGVTLVFQNPTFIGTNLQSAAEELERHITAIQRRRFSVNAGRRSVY